MANYLSVENLSQSWGETILFNKISFGIDEGQKVALIARNGTGKTTLLDILAGKRQADEGNVIYRNNLRVGYLSQDPGFDNQLTVLEAVFSYPNPILQTIKQYENALEHNDADRLGTLMSEMDKVGAWDYESRIKQILNELKINHFDQKIQELSGGQRKRVALASILISEPEFLILDEPTNHLDLEMIEWMEDYLKRSKATLLMVTHDRYFLDRVCNEIIEMDDQTIYTYKGNYSYFITKRDERIEMKNTEIERAKNLLRKEQDWMNRQPQARATKAKYRIDAFYDLKDKASQGKIEKELNLDIKTTRLGSKIIEFEDIYKKFDDKIILDGFSYKFARKEKIGIVGDNGTGKTTFLNIITNQLAADSGNIEVGETVVFGYFKQHTEEIDPNKKLIEVISDISENITLGDGKQMNAAAFLRYFLFPNEMHYTPVAKLSGGERKRLFLMMVLMRNPNFLILDEPTNDLDIYTLNVLEDYLQNFPGCLIIVSHDRYFMDKLVDHLFVFKGNGVIKDFPGNYSDLFDFKEQQLKESKKEEKAQKAIDVQPVEKEKARKLSYKEKKEIETLEADMDKLQLEKTHIETALNSGSLSADEITEMAKKLNDILIALETKELRWLELSELDV